MKIGIIGTGGVGGYFGGKICRVMPLQDMEVYFVARGQHLEEIRKHGLLISTAEEGSWVCNPTLATARVEELPTLDICLICVKSYDLQNIVRQLRIEGKITNTTLVLPLLNGLDIHERIREVLPTARLFPACVYVGTHIETFGKVSQHGGTCKILLGRDPQEVGFVPTPLFELFDKSRISYEWFDDVYPEIWKKFIFIAAFGLVTAAFDKTLGQVMESKEVSDCVISVVGEVVALSRKKGIDLPESIITETYEKGHNFPYELKTSFQRDFQSPEKPDERDLFGGTVLRLSKTLGVESPVTERLWNILNEKKPFPIH